MAPSNFPQSFKSFPVIVAAFLLAASAVLDQALNIYSTLSVIAGIGVTLVIFLKVIYTQAKLMTNQHDEKLCSLIAQLSEIVPERKYSWLYSDAELALFEGNAGGKEIWIISPDLLNVADKPVIQNVVKANLRRGITYTYIVPHKDEINGIIPSLRKTYEGFDAQLKIRG